MGAIDLPTNIEEIGHALTAAEVGDLLSLGRIELYKHTKSGTIPSFNIGISVRYDPYRVAAWLRTRSR